MEPRKIIIVEDDKMMAEAICDIVEAIGHQPTWAPAGPEAIISVSGNNYDLVILDLELPKMSGTEVAQQLLTIAPELRILYTTGSIEQEDRFQSHDPRIAGVIYKPFDMSDLKSAIEMALDES